MSTHTFANHTVDPSAPPADQVRLYAKADGLFVRESSGAVRRLDGALASPTAAKQTTTVMTTSTTDVALPGASITVLEPGLYVVLADAEVSVDSSDEITVSLYNNGSQVVDTERKHRQHSHGAFTETSSVLALHDVITVASANDVVQLRWRTTGGTATSRGRGIVLQKVG
jgi:hypothetical protein